MWPFKSVPRKCPRGIAYCPCIESKADIFIHSDFSSVFPPELLAKYKPEELERIVDQLLDRMSQ